MADSLVAIIPLFALISLGYLARRTILDVRMLPALNQFVYYFAVPALLFNSARQQTLAHLFNWPALSAFTLGSTVTALLAIAGSRWWFQCKAHDELFMRGLNSVFANYAYMGIPLTFGLLGDATHAPTISIILAGNLLIIGGTQLMIEIQRQHSASWRQVWVILDRSLVRNPIVIAPLLGLLVAGLRLNLPTVFATTLTMLAPAAIAVALFCLGASLEFRRTQTSLTEISWLIAMKLLVHPALIWLAFRILSVNDIIWLKACVLLCALPTGALAHVIAMRYDLFEKASSQIIVLSTLLSLISVSFWASLIL